MNEFENDLPKWEIANSQYLVDDQWLRLRADNCVVSRGRIIEPFYVLEYRDWTNCLVIDGNSHVLMVKQYRHGIGDYVIELPGGGIEQGESTVEATRRELKEELGYTGGMIFEVGVSYPNPANQTNKVHSFLAIGGNCDAQPELELGENLVVEKIPLEVFLKQITEPTANIYQSMHLATIFMVFNFVERSSLAELQSLKSALKNIRQ